jgi:signal transduction histidine kinase
MLGRLRIGQKLAMLVAVPLAFAATAGALVATETRADASEARQVTQTVSLLDPTVKLLAAVRVEQATIVLGRDAPPYVEAVKAVDQAFDALIARDNLASFGETFPASLRDARTNITDIRLRLDSFGEDVTRMRIDRAFIGTPRGGEIGNTITSYTPRVTRLIVGAIDITAKDVSDSASLRKIQAVQQVLELNEWLGDEALGSGFALQQWSANDIVFARLLASTVARSFGATDNAVAAIRQHGNTELTSQFNTVLGSESGTQLFKVRTTMARYFGSPDGAALQPPTDPDTLSKLYGDTLTALAGLLNQSAQDLSADSQVAADDAQQRANLISILAFGLLLFVVMLSIAVYRSVAVPIRTLTKRTTDIAETELPQMMASLRELGADDVIPALPVLEVSSNDEVAELVKAFNSLQSTTIDLAAAQARSRRKVAEMFVNLGRRNQKLLSRQLTLLNEFQKEETDPRKLGELYAVDQIATRMRRNAESLLVLAGTVPPRQFAKPVPIGNVLRGALAEVEGYQRVRIDGTFDTVSVDGSATADVTHLLAELLENALRFSPEDSFVQVMTRANESRCIIHISDAGIGMNPESLAELTRNFVEAASTDEVPTRQLGLFVVARLAARHGIDVTFHEGALGGLAVRVSINVPVVTIDKVSAHHNWQLGSNPVATPGRVVAVPNDASELAPVQPTPVRVPVPADTGAAPSVATTSSDTPAVPLRRVPKTPRAKQPETQLESAPIPSVPAEQVAATLAGFVGGFRRSAEPDSQLVHSSTGGSPQADRS